MCIFLLHTHNGDRDDVKSAVHFVIHSFSRVETGFRDDDIFSPCLAVDQCSSLYMAPIVKEITNARMISSVFDASILFLNIIYSFSWSEACHSHFPTFLLPLRLNLSSHSRVSSEVSSSISL